MTEAQFDYLASKHTNYGDGPDAAKRFFVNGEDRKALVEEYGFVRTTLDHSIRRFKEFAKQEGWVETDTYLLPPEQFEAHRKYSEGLVDTLIETLRKQLSRQLSKLSDLVGDLTR